MITRDDWLAALETAQAMPPEGDPDALTMTELCALFDRGRNTTDLIIKKLVAAGKAERTTKPIRMVNGAWRRAPAYRLVTDGEAQ